MELVLLNNRELQFVTDLLTRVFPNGVARFTVRLSRDFTERDPGRLRPQGSRELPGRPKWTQNRVILRSNDPGMLGPQGLPKMILRGFETGCPLELIPCSSGRIPVQHICPKLCSANNSLYFAHFAAKRADSAEHVVLRGGRVRQRGDGAVRRGGPHGARLPETGGRLDRHAA